MRIGNMLKEQEAAENAQITADNSQYKILAVDDEGGIIDSLSIFLNRSRIYFCRRNRPS